jgi:hypothetical protein
VRLPSTGPASRKALLTHALSPSRGHGQALYNAVFASVSTRQDVAELTVEDPSEAFEDLRDVCDLRTIVAGIERGEWKGKLALRPGQNGAPVVDKEWLEAKRRELKIAPVRSPSHTCCVRHVTVLADDRFLQLARLQRQFSRLYEMLLLHYLENVERSDGSTPTEAEGRAFRLFVKERLYRFNYVRPSLRPSRSHLASRTDRPSPLAGVFFRSSSSRSTPRSGSRSWPRRLTT